MSLAPAALFKSKYICCAFENRKWKRKIVFASKTKRAVCVHILCFVFVILNRTTRKRCTRHLFFLLSVPFSPWSCSRNQWQWQIHFSIACSTPPTIQYIFPLNHFHLMCVSNLQKKYFVRIGSVTCNSHSHSLSITSIANFPSALHDEILCT